MKKILLSWLLWVCLLVNCLSAAAEVVPVEVVAQSPYQWTGLALSQQDRLFVCYPTWRNYPGFKVAEIVAGRAVAYPDAVTAARFSCVQSVYVDAENYLWVLDTGKPRGQVPQAGTARLYKLDLHTNKIIWQYAFPPSVDLANSYLNDVRVDTKRHFAYLTDSGAGGIIVVNLQDKQPASWRALTDIPQVKAQQEGINFVSTGYDRHQTPSDGLALTEDGRTLYFAALTGHSLYSIPAAKLRDKKLTVPQRAGLIRTVSRRTVPTDGLWLKQDKIYLGDLAAEGLFVYDLKTQQGRRLSAQVPLRWADSFAEDSQGRIYFTTSQINYRDQPPEAYRIYRLPKQPVLADLAGR